MSRRTAILCLVIPPLLCAGYLFVVRVFDPFTTRLVLSSTPSLDGSEVAWLVRLNGPFDGATENFSYEIAILPRGVPYTYARGRNGVVWESYGTRPDRLVWPDHATLVVELSRSRVYAPSMIELRDDVPGVTVRNVWTP